MTSKKTSYPPVNLGTSLMLVVFIILCMIVFAVLSLSGALKDLAFSETLASRTNSWYEANNQAEEILADIDRILSGPDSEEAKLQKLQAIEGLTITMDVPENQPYTVDTTDTLVSSIELSYTIPIDDNEVLQVELSTTPQKKHPYTITSWQQLSIQEWNGNETLPVLGSESQ